ncbi:MAG: 2-isopropylmalate synthase [Limnochordales bacterium]|nr:2-isopropylmalate synthase [Limnochordales bacterium]
MAKKTQLGQPTRPVRKLVHVDEPNLLREQFPYTEPPRILFDGVQVPYDLPEEIFITDTTFRDGQQARPPFSRQQIVDLFDMMHRLSGPNGVIRQTEFFLYTKRDREAVEACLERGYRYPEITAWIRANRKDLELVKSMGLRETGILTSCSDYHIFLKLGWNREEALRNYLDVVTAALEAGIRPRCHFEDVTRADIEGFVIPFAQELMRLQEMSGIPIKVRLCDTMGYGVPYPGAVLPRSVPRLVHALVHEAGVPKAQLEWHGHNDFYKGLINASTAWLYGVAGANGTLLGIGERTGNTPVEGLLIEYAGLMGGFNGADPTVITEIAEYMTKTGTEIPPNQPFVGKHFNTTSAGIHADGVLKNEEIYNIFDTRRLLGRPIGVAVTDKSGLAGIAWWVNRQLGLTGDKRLPKDHPLVRQLHEWVQQQYAAGRTTAIEDEELLAVAQQIAPQLFAGVAAS